MSDEHSVSGACCYCFTGFGAHHDRGCPREMTGTAFDEYVAEIEKLARIDGWDGAGHYCDPDAWQDAYNDGITAEEAWASERSYWTE